MADLIRRNLQVINTASIQAEVRADGRCFIVRDQNGKRQVVPATSRLAECLIISAVEESSTDLPSRSDVKMIIDILIGRAMAGVDNMVEECSLRVPRIVDLILEFMEGKATWSGKTCDLFEAIRKLAAKSAGLFNLPESTRVFSEEIQKHESMFRERGLLVGVSHRRHGSTTEIVRMDAGEMNADTAAPAPGVDSQTGDASDAGDARYCSDEEREALEAMAELSVNDQGTEKH